MPRLGSPVRIRSSAPKKDLIRGPKGPLIRVRGSAVKPPSPRQVRESPRTGTRTGATRGPARPLRWMARPGLRGRPGRRSWSPGKVRQRPENDGPGRPRSEVAANRCNAVKEEGLGVGDGALVPVARGGRHARDDRSHRKGLRHLTPLLLHQGPAHSLGIYGRFLCGSACWQRSGRMRRLGRGHGTYTRGVSRLDRITSDPDV